MTYFDEKAILERILKAFPRSSAEVGIGDDAAVIETGGRLVVTNDLLVDNIDFSSAIPPSFVAAKSLAVNLSDLASMGARPAYFVLALAMPPSFLPYLDEFIDSLAEASRRAGIELIGGDLSRAEALSISITAMGRLEGRALLRSTARPGDRIFLSRPVGGSAAGLELIRRGWRISSDGRVVPPDAGRFGFEQRAFAEGALMQHVSPEAETELGPRLALIDGVHACIDVSDGLSSDLWRLCEASRVGAILEWERIPPFRGLSEAGASLLDADDAMLNGGEELALLFTATSREAQLSALLGRPVYAIGSVTADTAVQLEKDGTRAPLAAAGFDHFRGRS